MTPAAKSQPKKPIAKKGPSSKDINKSEEIRKIANSMKAKGEKPRPVTIIEILKKQGIEVSSPQVSMVLKRMGFTPRKRAATGSASAGKPKTKVTVEDLVKAQKLVAEFGGTDRALAALEALKNFEG